MVCGDGYFCFYGCSRRRVVLMDGVFGFWWIGFENCLFGIVIGNVYFIFY